MPCGENPWEGLDLDYLSSELFPGLERGQKSIQREKNLIREQFPDFFAQMETGEEWKIILPFSESFK